MNPRRVFLRITSTHSSPVLEAFALARRAEVDPIIVVADEQQRRVDLLLLLVDGQRQPLVIEADQRPQRGDEHRQPLAPPEPLAAARRGRRPSADRGRSRCC